MESRYSFETQLEFPGRNKPQYKHSFFVETTIHWIKLQNGNQLPDKVVHADLEHHL